MPEAQPMLLQNSHLGVVGTDSRGDRGGQVITCAGSSANVVTNSHLGVVCWFLSDLAEGRPSVARFGLIVVTSRGVKNNLAPCGWGNSAPQWLG